MNFLFGSLLIGISVLLIYYSRHFEKRFGRWQWAEDYLGGTAQGYVVIGFFLMILGFMVLFGWLKVVR